MFVKTVKNIAPESTAEEEQRQDKITIVFNSRLKTTKH
jgi:hypothetical protein